MKTQMSIDSILFRVCLIRNQVFITDGGVGSLYFTLKSQEVWKVTSQQQIFALINIPWAITCERGIGAQRGTPAKETAGERGEEKIGGNAIHPAAQIRVWEWNTWGEYWVKDGQRGKVNLDRVSEKDDGGGERVAAQRGHTHTDTHKIKWMSRHFPKPSSCLLIITSQNKSVGNKLFSGHWSYLYGCWRFDTIMLIFLTDLILS